MHRKCTTFADWPQDSIDRFTEMLRQIIREEVHGTTSAPTTGTISVLSTQGIAAAKTYNREQVKQRRK